ARDCYRPTEWDLYWWRIPCRFVMQRLDEEGLFGTSKLVSSWRDAVLDHTLGLPSPPRRLFREFPLGRHARDVERGHPRSHQGHLRRPAPLHGGKGGERYSEADAALSSRRLAVARSSPRRVGLASAAHRRRGVRARRQPVGGG